MSHLWHKFNLFKYFWPGRVGATTHRRVTTQLTFLDSINLLSRVCCFYSKMCLFVNITCTAVLLPTKLPFHLTLDSTTMWLFVRFMNIYIQDLPIDESNGSVGNTQITSFYEVIYKLKFLQNYFGLICFFRFLI